MRDRRLGLALVALAFVVTATVFPLLPAVVPIHWGGTGRPNGYAPRAWGAFAMPATVLLVFGVFEVIALLFPRASAVERFRATYHRLQLAVTAFMFFMAMVVLRAQAGFPIDMNRTVWLGTGVLFVVIGNLLGKIPPNYLTGIRTPWTLRDPEVWLRTHRLGGFVFMGAGALLCGSALLGGRNEGAFTVIAAAALIPAIYSFLIRRR